jgi:heat shock protein HslJ
VRHLAKAPSVLVMTAGIATIVAACAGSMDPTGSASAPPSPSPDRLDGTSWSLVSVNDEPVAAGTAVTLSFASGMVSGSSGCNSYSGTYSVDGPTLAVGPLITTKMACPEPIMAVETAYLAALEAANRWAVPQDALMGTQLTLLGSGQKLVFGPPASATG